MGFRRFTWAAVETLPLDKYRFWLLDPANADLEGTEISCVGTPAIALTWAPPVYVCCTFAHFANVLLSSCSWILVRWFEIQRAVRPHGSHSEGTRGSGS